MSVERDSLYKMPHIDERNVKAESQLDHNFICCSEKVLNRTRIISSPSGTLTSCYIELSLFYTWFSLFTTLIDKKKEVALFVTAI